jgi:hypothetical protein
MNPNSGACGRYPTGRVRASGARRNALVFAILASLLAILSACSSTSGGAKDEDAGDPYAPTFTAIYNNILQGTCAQPFCHLGSTTPMAMPDQATAYKVLVNVASDPNSNCMNMGWTRVVPGDPAKSLLYEKIELPIPANICGLHMPRQGVDLEAKQIAQIKQWIMLGAKND